MHCVCGIVSGIILALYSALMHELPSDTFKRPGWALCCSVLQRY